MPRPKSFNPDEALMSAMEVFWDKGFEGASVSELTDAMGINRFSLYDTFGDKHQLYMQALARYEEISIEPLITSIDSIASLDDVRTLFASLIEHAINSSDKPCCMILRASVAGAHDGPDACKKVSSIQERIVEAFTHAIERLIASGQTDPKLDPSDAAWSLFTLQSGIVANATLAPSAAPLLASVEHWISAAKS